MIQASHYIRQVYRAFKAYSATGVTLSRAELDAFNQHLMTIHEIVVEMEEENALLQKQLGRPEPKRVPIANPDSGNVIRLPVRARVVVSNGGGDAA